MQENAPLREAWWQKATGRVRKNVAAIESCLDPQQRCRSRLHRAVCYIRRLSDAYANHQCSLMACACAYCAVLSLVPLLIVGIAIFGYVKGGSQHVLNDVVLAINDYVPIRAGFLKETLSPVLQDRKLIGLFGLGGLLFAAHQTFMAMEPAMNIIWVVPETRHWLKQRLIALGATVCSLLLLGIDLVLSAFIVMLQSRSEPIFSIHPTTVLLHLAVFLLPVLVVTLAFALIYQFLPARSVPWKPAFVGAGVAAVLWQLTKIGFGAFLLHFNSYNRLYGSLGGVVILVVWAYYSMAILLLGAEVAADYESTRHGARAAEARAHSGADLQAAHGTNVVTTPPTEQEQA